MAEESEGNGGRGRIVAAVGIAAFGVAAGAGAVAAAGAALVRADRRRASEASWFDLELPDDLARHHLETSDGGNLHFVERGEGRPIVLLHGITLSHRIWPYQLRSLPELGYRVIALDQRSHGESHSGSDGATLDAMARDLAELLEQLDLNGAVVVGHSMGSMVTINFAGRHGDVLHRRVAALGLIGAAPCVPKVTRRLSRAAGVIELGTSALDSREMTLLPGGDLGYLFARLAFGSRPDPHHVALTRDVSGSMPPVRFGELLPRVLAFDGRSYLPGIEVPTLVTIGPVDRLLPVSCHRYLVSSIPGARGLELPGCGHMPMLERHDELDGALDELASGLPATSGDRLADRPGSDDVGRLNGRRSRRQNVRAAQAAARGGTGDPSGTGAPFA